MAERHGGVIDRLRRAGDPLGIHVHPYRWNAERRVAYSDHADTAWVTHCLQVAAETFGKCFGEPVRRGCQGGYFLSEAVIDASVALGIEVDVTPEPGETVTDAVKQFHETGVNPYDGNEEAIADGKSVYTSNCQVCHGDTLKGGAFGAPSLVDDKVRHSRVVDDVGMFEVIYGGAASAMAGFKGRLTQDQILKVIAYVRSQKK